MLNLENSSCTKCGLCKARKNVINGIGSPTAQILFIGEAPSLEDDLRNRAFSSNQSKYFFNLLSETGIDAQACFYTTVVRCVPKGPPPGQTTREPSWEEVQACLPYLKQEISGLRPNLIVPLGNTALRAILGVKKATISSFRGKEFWSTDFSCKVLPIFNPNDVLRNPAKESLFLVDLKRVKASSCFPQLTKTTEGAYVVLDTIDKVTEFFERIQKVEAFSFDIETSGLNWKTDELLCLSFSWSSGTGVVLPLTSYLGIPKEVEETKTRFVRKKKDGNTVREEKVITKLVSIVEDSYVPFWGDKQSFILDKLKELMSNDILKIAHNGKFDCKFLMQRGIFVNNFAFDTMLAHHLLDENAEGAHGLKECALRYTDLGDYSKPIEEWFLEKKIVESRRNYAHLPSDLLYKYAAMDADVTFRLYEIFSEELKNENLENLFYRITMPTNESLLYAEFEGIQIDLNYLYSVKTSLEEEIDQIKVKITNMVGEINLDSPKQLVVLLHTKLGLPIRSWTPKKQPSCNEAALQELSGAHPVPALILKYRELEKLYTTYICGLENLVDKKGCIHTEFLLHGTTTGRLSSRRPNLQNIPKEDTRIKDLFVAKDGWVIVESDYAQAEFRYWADYSKDAQMLKDLKEGLDIHKNTAASVANVPVEQVTKQMRNQAKRIVFGLMYGMGVQKLAMQNKCSEAHAEKVIRLFFSRYPDAKLWLRRVVQVARRHGYVVSSFGRKRRLPGINHPDLLIKSEAERQAANSPIQSSASDLTCNAANRIRRALQQRGLNGRLRLLIHDAIVLEVPKAEVQETLSLIKEEMLRPVPGMVVQMGCEIKVGERWGSASEVVQNSQGQWESAEKGEVLNAH